MPADLDQRDERRRAILRILRRTYVVSQKDLVSRLRMRGFEATQSSVSRDLRDLGVAKVGGRYQAPIEGADPTATKDFASVAGFLREVRVAGPHLVVLHTAVGAAPSVALAIDAAPWPEVVGTVAGNDTIFIATANAGDRRTVALRLNTLINER
jgi:transcriptional regulator of arginine metabolism